MQNYVSQAAWCISGERSFHKKSWQSELVVFDDASGDTIRLDFLAAEILFIIDAADELLKSDVITSNIARQLDEPVDERLVNRVRQSLSNLKKLGFIAQSEID